MRQEVGRLGEAAAEPRWQETALWKALAAMRIEPPGAALSFVERLAIDHDWDGCFAEAVYGQYLRFLYLSATSNGPLTPSEAVDQAWHLHLAYSRHYWTVLCDQILKRPFHHGPTAGGSAEAAKHRAQYEETLVRYRETFGAPPPADIWPPTHVRFSARPVWVDRSSSWVVPKRRARTAAVLAGLAVLTAACTTGDIGPMERFALLLVAIVIGFGVVAHFVSRGNRRREDGSCSGCGGGGYDSGGDGDGGGCGGCGGGD